MEDKKIVKMFEVLQEGQQKIQKSLGYVSEMVAHNSEDITLVKNDMKPMKKDMETVKGDIKSMKENISDLQASSNRIETLVHSEIKYVDDLSGRVLKLEPKKA